MSLSWIPSHNRVLELEDALADTFAVHEVTATAGGKVIVFKGQFLRSPEMVYDQIVGPFKLMGYVPILREENGSDILMAYPAPATSGASRPLVHLGLFAATLVSTLWAGTYQQTGQTDPAFFLANWTAGLPFAAALIAILGVHEFGHYFVARYYGLDVSLPYFIPFPLNPLIGTMGAVIRIKSPFESKKALFDVGIAGPLAGLVVAVVVLVAGLIQAEVAPIGSGLVFNEPLLFRFLAWLIVGERPPGTDILMNPFLMAGWLGLLITAINLLPVSQLDGGHIAYAILGRRYRPFAWTVFAIVALVTLLVTPGFVVMVLFIFLMGIEHPPALNDLTRIDGRRVALGVLTLLLALTLVTPSPFETRIVGPP